MTGDDLRALSDAAPTNPGEHPRSWIAESCVRTDPPAEGVYCLPEGKP